MANNGREQLWRDRIAQLQASGMTQRAYAIEHGYSEHQVGYWVRRITKPQDTPSLLPVRVASSATPAVTPIALCNERGWTLTLPGNVPASWLAELMRAL